MDFIQLLKLATNALVVNKLRSILTTLGIIIGVFAIILLVSLGTGLQGYITTQISGLGSNLLFVIPGAAGGARTPGGVVTDKLLLSDANTLAFRLKSFANVAPFVQKSSAVTYKNKSDSKVSIAGSSYNYSQIVSIKIDRGASFTQGQQNSGAKVAMVGPTVVTKLFPTEDPLGKVITVGSSRFTII
ncbi:MAG: ABC transporter permease, partial [Patescibacteria group bacterium]|nr:ABC transporter permease [Patescibacteria group bacterium]